MRNKSHSKIYNNWRGPLNRIPTKAAVSCSRALDTFLVEWVLIGFAGCRRWAAASVSVTGAVSRASRRGCGARL